MRTWPQQYLEVDKELDEGGASAVQHALCGVASLQTALVWKRNAQRVRHHLDLTLLLLSHFTFGLELGLRGGPRPDALEGAADLPDAVGVPGAEEGVLDERGHVARQVAQVRRQGNDVRAAGKAGAEGRRAARQVARRRPTKLDKYSGNVIDQK